LDKKKTMIKAVIETIKIITFMGGFLFPPPLLTKKIPKLIYGLACWICSKCTEILLSPLNNHPANVRLY